MVKYITMCGHVHSHANRHRVSNHISPLIMVVACNNECVCVLTCTESTNHIF